MARGRPGTHYVTVSGTSILIGRGLYEQAESPPYIFATWDDESVTLHREEEYETKGQGIYRIVLAGEGKGNPRITAKALVEGAGLVPGRYFPTLVDSTRIIFPKTPMLMPETYTPKKPALDDEEVEE
jgi:hypothetical protein